MMTLVSMKVLADYPLEDIIWTPGLIITNNRFFYNVLMLLLHVLPAVFIDGLLQFAGKHPRYKIPFRFRLMYLLIVVQRN